MRSHSCRRHPNAQKVEPVPIPRPQTHSELSLYVPTSSLPTYDTLSRLPARHPRRRCCYRVPGAAGCVGELEGRLCRKSISLLRPGVQYLDFEPEPKCVTINRHEQQRKKSGRRNLAARDERRSFGFPFGFVVWGNSDKVVHNFTFPLSCGPVEIVALRSTHSTLTPTSLGPASSSTTSILQARLCHSPFAIFALKSIWANLHTVLLCALPSRMKYTHWKHLWTKVESWLWEVLVGDLVCGCTCTHRFINERCYLS
ncbi:hypothetical protein CPC08DRAFT_712947 [Agrocybe pediades]|nr:hypothetical protein CPC08DRAFT_712947 [Agrocybe pediades]